MVSGCAILIGCREVNVLIKGSYITPLTRFLWENVSMSTSHKGGWWSPTMIVVIIAAGLVSICAFFYGCAWCWRRRMHQQQNINTSSEFGGWEGKPPSIISSPIGSMDGILVNSDDGTCIEEEEEQNQLKHGVYQLIWKDNQPNDISNID